MAVTILTLTKEMEEIKEVGKAMVEAAMEQAKKLQVKIDYLLDKQKYLLDPKTAIINDGSGYKYKIMMNILSGEWTIARLIDEV